MATAQGCLARATIITPLSAEKRVSEKSFAPLDVCSLPPRPGIISPRLCIGL